MNGNALDAVIAMEQRILLAFALNGVPAMSPAALQSCAAVSWRRGEPAVFATAVQQMAERGALRIGAYVAGDCRIPAIMPNPDVALPDSAAALRRRSRLTLGDVVATHRPRFVIPLESGPDTHSLFTPRVSSGHGD
jgi:hypothetical protein